MRFVKALLAASVLAVVAVPNAMAFRFDDAARTPPTAVTGQPYDHALPTVAGCKGVEIKVLSGALPPGLSITGSKRVDEDGSNWRIVGTPTAAGEFPFWLQATNICWVDFSNPPDGVADGPESTEEPFMIRVVSGLSINQRAVPGGTVGVPYPTTQLTAAGGGTQTWTITAGTLPAGLSFAPNGVISGTPTAASTTQVTFAVGDGSRSDTETLTFNIREPLNVTAATVPMGQIDKPFTYRGLAATGGSGVISKWSVFSGALPPGVAIDPATGALTGTPTEAGSFSAVVRAEDNEGRWKDTRVVLRVASPVEIVTQRLAALRIGRLYSLAIRTEGGVGIRRYGRDTFNWKILRGKLPIGLRLNTRVGKLIGRPRQSGTFRITFQVTDKFRSVDTQTLVIKVNKAS